MMKWKRVDNGLVTVCVEGRGGALTSRTLPPWAVAVPRDQWWPGASSVGRGHVSAAEEVWDDHHLPLLLRSLPPALPAWDGAAEKLDPQQASPHYLLLTHSDSHCTVFHFVNKCSHFLSFLFVVTPSITSVKELIHPIYCEKDILQNSSVV